MDLDFLASYQVSHCVCFSSLLYSKGYRTSLVFSAFGCAWEVVKAVCEGNGVGKLFEVENMSVWVRVNPSDFLSRTFVKVS